MRIYISQTRTIALSIANNLVGEQRRHDDYIEIGDDVVIWSGGRLLEMCEPGYYDNRWTKWDATRLPIIVQPDQWQLTPRIDKTSKLPDPRVKKKLAIFERLLKGTSLVICVNSLNTEGNNEGLMLTDDIIAYFGFTGEVVHLDLNIKKFELAELEEIIQNVRRNKLLGSDYQNFRNAELCRSRSSWLIGKNLTRAVTKLLSHDHLITIGRLQTPLLGLIVRRCIAIENKAALLRNYYTASSLLNDMQVFARCSIHDIDALRRNGFIVSDQSGKIKDTSLGRALIKALPKQLSDESVLAAWESALNQVAAGNYSPEEFMRRTDLYVAKMLQEVRALSGKVVIYQNKPESLHHQKKTFERRVHTANKPITSKTGSHHAIPQA